MHLLAHADGERLVEMCHWVNDVASVYIRPNSDH